LLDQREQQLESPSFAAFVVGLLDAPERLTLEITETAVVDDVETAQHALRDLAAAGVGLSVDDFGAGYTSLGRLRGVPLTEIKIDRSFVEESSENRAIVRGVVALAKGRPVSVETILVPDPGPDQIRVLGDGQVHGDELVVRHRDIPTDLERPGDDGRFHAVDRHGNPQRDDVRQHRLQAPQFLFRRDRF